MGVNISDPWEETKHVPLMNGNEYEDQIKKHCFPGHSRDCLYQQSLLQSSCRDRMEVEVNQLKSILSAPMCVLHEKWSSFWRNLFSSFVLFGLIPSTLSACIFKKC